MLVRVIRNYPVDNPNIGILCRQLMIRLSLPHVLNPKQRTMTWNFLCKWNWRIFYIAQNFSIAVYIIVDYGKRYLKLLHKIIPKNIIYSWFYLYFPEKNFSTAKCLVTTGLLSCAEQKMCTEGALITESDILRKHSDGTLNFKKDVWKSYIIINSTQWIRTISIGEHAQLHTMKTC